jgi:DUF971 family protein
MSKTAFDPERIDRMGEEGLKIRWADGHESIYPFGYLRQSCPCAACSAGGGPTAGHPKKQGVPIRAASLPLEIQPVGRYALTIRFSDGHKTGIFAYEYLRSLCRCEACAPRQFMEG